MYLEEHGDGGVGGEGVGGQGGGGEGVGGVKRGNLGGSNAGIEYDKSEGVGGDEGALGLRDSVEKNGIENEIIGHHLQNSEMTTE